MTTKHETIKNPEQQKEQYLLTEFRKSKYFGKIRKLDGYEGQNEEPITKNLYLLCYTENVEKGREWKFSMLIHHGGERKRTNLETKDM